MARPYSQDLRARVVAAVDGDLSRRAAAGRFAVAVSTVIDWVDAWEDEGRLVARPMGGDHRSRLKEERAWLLELIEATPDLTLEEIHAALASRSIHVGHGTVWRFFAAEGVSFKKIVHASEQERPDVAAARVA
jgi:transposase